MLGFCLRTGSQVTGAKYINIVEYLLTQPLTLDTGYYYTENTGIDQNTDGKLINLADGLAWTPTALEYPEDGTIDLSGGKAIDTQIIFSPSEKWTYPQVYNVDGLGNYDVVALRYKGNGTADVWRADQGTSLSLSADDTGLSYTPPLTSYKVIEFPEIPAKAVFTFSGIANITDTLAHQITITCNTHIDPATFSTADITGDNGVISNLVQSATNPLVWTFDYTANGGVIDTTNVITIGTAIADLWGNLPASASVSANFEIATGVALGAELVTNANFDTDLVGWTGVSFIWDAGTARDNILGGYDALTQNGVSTSNYLTKLYRVSYEVVGATSGGARLKFNNVYANGYQPNGVYEFDLSTTGTLTQVLILTDAAFDGAINYISVKEIL